MIRDRNILVTGGAGFIGSNLCDKLLERGAKVRVLDNFSTGKKENVAAFAGHSGFTLIEGDIRSLDTCRQAVDGVDYVLHQAALGSVPRSIEDPVTTNEVNISGFLNMLVAARDARVERFVYAASSSTYGDSETLPKVEDNIGIPLSPYAVTKLVNELYAGVFARTYGMETIGLRYFNVFGRRQDPHGSYASVIPLFVRKLINGEAPVINGQGEYSRDFTYIDNVVQANILALETKNPDAVNQVYNVAFGERTSLNQLVGYLKEFLAAYHPGVAAIEPEYGDYREGDVPHSLADVGKARRLLGYAPLFSVRDGLKETIDWYVKNLG